MRPSLFDDETLNKVTWKIANARMKYGGVKRH